MEDVRQILAAGLHPILRVDPPTDPYIQEVRRRLAGLSSQEEERVFIDSKCMPTKFRRTIYEQAHFYIQPKRFDAFLFLRELEICGLQVWVASSN